MTKAVVRFRDHQAVWLCLILRNDGSPAAFGKRLGQRLSELNITYKPFFVDTVTSAGKLVPGMSDFALKFVSEEHCKKDQFGRSCGWNFKLALPSDFRATYWSDYFGENIKFNFMYDVCSDPEDAVSVTVSSVVDGEIFSGSKQAFKKWADEYNADV